VSDLGTTPRRARLSTKARLAIFLAHNGECHLCGGKIKPGEAWDVSHDRPLALLGEDDDTNRKPAHRKCHRAHTAAVDIPAIAKAKRLQAAHLGIKKAKRPMPGSRASGLKKCMDGRVVRR
jgi:5-methylcytosine-specific restriction endonuclease McrA